MTYYRLSLARSLVAVGAVTLLPILPSLLAFLVISVLMTYTDAPR